MAHHRHRARSATVALLGVSAAAGLLIWGKLRLLADVPRSAYAERGDETANGDDANESDKRVNEGRDPAPSN